LRAALPTAQVLLVARDRELGIIRDGDLVLTN
jgi:hypothetical protein